MIIRTELILLLAITFSGTHGLCRDTVLVPEPINQDFECLLKTGNKALDHLKYKEALASFVAASALSPSSCEVRFLVAKCYLGMQDTDHALEQYDQIISQGKKECLAEAHFAKSSVFQRKHQLLKAIEECKIAIKMDPILSVQHWYLGHLYRENNQLKSAIEQYELIAKVSPSSAIWRDLEQVYLSNGNSTKAENAHLQAERLDKELKMKH